MLTHRFSFEYEQERQVMRRSIFCIITVKVRMPLFDDFCRTLFVRKPCTIAAFVCSRKTHARWRGAAFFSPADSANIREGLLLDHGRREEKEKKKTTLQFFFFCSLLFSLLRRTLSLYIYRQLSLDFSIQLVDLFCSSSDCSLQIVLFNVVVVPSTILSKQPIHIR